MTTSTVTRGLISMVVATFPMAGLAATAQVLPTVYEAGHFYATPETVSGQDLKLLVDTGGGGGPSGLYWITVDAAKRLHLETRACRWPGHSLTVADLPDYQVHRSLPPPPANPCGRVVMVQDATPYNGSDGQFSGKYLYSKGIWTFDYPDRRLTLQAGSWRPVPAAHATPLAFQRDQQGRVTEGYARITVRIDGRPTDMLLDTGATAHPTPAGERAAMIPTVNGFGVTSYIVRSVFERWHEDHPDWRVIDDGDRMPGQKRPAPIIEVPEVEIAGWSVGPVWFTERPDRAFHGMMTSMMDRRVDGAVGGNVFRHFVMTIDYPRAVAYFRCVRTCTDAVTRPPAP